MRRCLRAAVICFAFALHPTASVQFADNVLNATQCTNYAAYSTAYIEPSYAMVNGARSCTFETNYSCGYQCIDFKCMHVSSNVVLSCAPNSTMRVNHTLQDQLNDQCANCSHGPTMTTTSGPAVRTPSTTRKPKAVHHNRNYRIAYVAVIGSWLIALCGVLQCSKAKEEAEDPPAYKQNGFSP